MRHVKHCTQFCRVEFAAFGGQGTRFVSLNYSVQLTPLRRCGASRTPVFRRPTRFHQRSMLFIGISRSLYSS
jgi:hypothetical protein